MEYFKRPETRGQLLINSKNKSKANTDGAKVNKLVMLFAGFSAIYPGQVINLYRDRASAR